MRITFIIFKLNFESGGGSTSELDAKIRGLQNKGHTVSAITLFSNQNKLASNVPYPVVERQLQSSSPIPLARDVARVLREFESSTDIFHLEAHFGYGSGWYRSSGGKRPTVVHCNRELSSFTETTRRDGKNTTSFKRRLRLVVERLFGFPLFNKNDLVTFTSPFLQAVYVGCGLHKNKTTVIPDCFDPSELPVDKIKAAARTQKSDTIELLSGGRMVFEKGFDIVIRAVGALPKNLNWHLTLTGDGPEKEKLVSVAAELGISDKISFTSWLTKAELYTAYAGADIYIVPRWRPELTSMLVLEAMTFGVPQIVTRGTAIAWQAGESAVTFADENVGELSSQIERLMKDALLRETLSQKGDARLVELEAKTVIHELDSRLSLLHNNRASER